MIRWKWVTQVSRMCFWRSPCDEKRDTFSGTIGWTTDRPCWPWHFFLDQILLKSRFMSVPFVSVCGFYYYGLRRLSLRDIKGRLELPMKFIDALCHTTHQRWKSQLQTNNRTSPQDAFLDFNHLYIIIVVTANVGNIKFQLPNCENNWNWCKQSIEINFILLSPGEPVAQWNQEFVTPACSLRYNQDLGEQSQRKLEDQQKAADQAVKGETDWEGIVKT
jgi:hypothetical protein